MWWWGAVLSVQPVSRYTSRLFVGLLVRLGHLLLGKERDHSQFSRTVSAVRSDAV